MRLVSGVRQVLWVRWVLLAMSGALLVSCGARTGAGSVVLPTAAGSLPPAPGSAAPGPAGADPVATAGRAVVDRRDPMVVYRAWWAAVGRALAHGDRDATELASLATDPLLGQTRRGIETLRAQGLVQVATVTLSPRQLSRSAHRVEIVDCVRTPAGSYRDARTGLPRAPAGYRNDIPMSDSLKFVLRWTNNGWYLVAATAAGGGQC